MNMMKAGGRVAIYFDDLQLRRPKPGLRGRPEVGRRPATGSRTRPRTSAGRTTSGSATPTTPAARRARSAAPSGARASTATTPTRSGRCPSTTGWRRAAGWCSRSGAPDADMFLGWFNGKEKEKAPTEAGHFLGVHVGGPTRVGHYFHPAFATAKGTQGVGRRRAGPRAGEGLRLVAGLRPGRGRRARGHPGDARPGIGDARAEEGDQGPGRRVRSIRVVHVHDRRADGEDLPGRPEIHGGSSGSVSQPRQHTVERSHRFCPSLAGMTTRMALVSRSRSPSGHRCTGSYRRASTRPTRGGPPPGGPTA